MDYSAIPTAKRVSMESALSAGNNAPQSSLTLELTASSHPPMEEVLAMLFGTKTSATERTLRVARSGEPSGTLSARRASTTSDAVSVHQIALLEP